MSYSRMALDPADIDTQDDAFRFTVPMRVERLVRSIHHVGLINPPIFISKGDRYAIVAGFQRVAAMCQMQYAKIPAWVMPAESSRLQCVRVAITDNLSQRKLNLLETARSLAMLSRHIDDPKELSTEAGALGLPDNVQHIEKLIGLCDLPCMIQEGICHGRISLNMAFELQTFDTAIANLLAKLFIKLKTNQNKQKEICTHLKEIASREKKRIQAVIDAEKILDVLADTQLDNQQKTRIIRSRLRQRRFPNLWRAEQTFQRNLQKLNLVKGIQLLPPEFFEDTHLKLNLSFQSKDELKAQVRALQKTLLDPHLDTLFNQ